MKRILEMRAQNEYPYMGRLFCPECGGVLKKKMFGQAPYWCCGEDNFYLRNYQMDKAIMRAYEVSEITWDEEITSPQLWWIDKLVEKIVIGSHHWNESTITVKWKNGQETTVPSKARHPWEVPDSGADKENSLQVKKPTKVRRIRAKG